MKKIIILSVIAAVFLIGAVVYSDMANKQAAEGNPFGKTNLNPATIAQLDDPNYGNQILPDELKAKLEGKEELFIYYYSPTCEHCQRTTPVLVPVADELKVDVKKHNLLEFASSWDAFAIEYTPTLVHYKDGKEVSRLVGEQTADELKQWFQEQKK
ncbi:MULTISPECIES: thioredoxin family protein [Brevibacillus]|jgi:thiol-disulfide isomerase/thioredoxin|uniref:Protein disulfide oxidoreductase n=1 Tax=Brevibacillus borstelensis AK1 TaxID=1300222 RepID=M8DBN4_9BACL|nr:thioredoxin family protein [Brevibacillus borstelensis]EMT50823.1 protein disulfide oxidoreductase [Brevibacillus borstelensis AK1]KKX55867.1 thioredoxin [Brevibacillus borstelensis cifa_chp40]MBE5396661.1 thioredoxin family protein [Brevibacillus borstelensis]MCC0566678.1 thioredoxin family protein [Brevibacillus borstelensis]MCM3472622.1 thioredoxin family protein [Brevibacillus borstelensis]